MDLHDQIERVKTKEDFIRFLEALMDDLEKRPEEWANPKLDMFLDGMLGWLKDMDSYLDHNGLPVSQEASWKYFAEILGAGRSYE